MIDLILTNIYSSPPFPLFTASNSNINLFDTSSIIIHILFIFSILAAICAVIAGCYHCLFPWFEMINSYQDTSSGFMNFGICEYCCFPICVAPCFIIGHYILAALYLVVILILFCFSPPFLLYIICIIFQLTNRPNVALLYHQQYNSNPFISKMDDIIDTINIISDRHEKYGLIHRRLSQYIMAYIISPQHSINYRKIQKSIINKIKLILPMKIDEVLAKLETECISIDDKDIYKEFIGKEEEYNDNTNLLNPMIDKIRMKIYITSLSIFYFIIISFFWLFYSLTDFYDHNVGDGNKHILIVFYGISYFLYLLIFYVIAWIFWKEFMLLIQRKYEWVFPLFDGSKVVQKEFEQRQFMKLYCIICYQYVTYQCLICAVDKNKLNNEWSWILKIIMEYLMQIDGIHNIENMINFVSGNEDLLNRFMFREYWKDPLNLHGTLDIDENNYYLIHDNINQRNCIQIQNESLIKCLTESINIEVIEEEKEYDIVQNRMTGNLKGYNIVSNEIQN